MKKMWCITYNGRSKSPTIGISWQERISLARHTCSTPGLRPPLQTGWPRAPSPQWCVPNPCAGTVVLYKQGQSSSSPQTLRIITSSQVYKTPALVQCHRFQHRCFRLTSQWFRVLADRTGLWPIIKLIVTVVQDAEKHTFTFPAIWSMSNSEDFKCKRFNMKQRKL